MVCRDTYLRRSRTALKRYFFGIRWSEMGEATFVAMSPSFLSDLFSEEHRGRIFGIFYLNIGLGTAVGYIIGGKLGEHFGWRSPFYVAAIPGFLLAIALAFLPEPVRGSQDLLKPTGERTTSVGPIPLMVHSGWQRSAWR